MLWRKSAKAPQISFLVPFRDDGEHRSNVWFWLYRYWSAMFPNDEIIVDGNGGYPFSKAVAVNNAAAKARGDIFIVIDADCYMDSAVLHTCANNISDSLTKLWYVPYLKLYRLTRQATVGIIRQDPTMKFDVSTPPPSNWLDSMPTYGHNYGAMVLMMPRAAFELVGGMDTRFKGWGGEDAAFMKSLDTLYALHQTTNNETLHLWHDRPGASGDPTKIHLTRTWKGQEGTNVNARLAHRYNLVSGDSTLMEALVNEKYL